MSDCEEEFDDFYNTINDSMVSLIDGWLKYGFKAAWDTQQKRAEKLVDLIRGFMECYEHENYCDYSIDLDEKACNCLIRTATEVLTKWESGNELR